MQFKKAERKQVKLKLAVTGPSGSGKTFSAMRIASGLGGKMAVIDTENGSASLYSDKFAFDVLEIQPPFTTEKYAQAINAAIEAKYDVLVIDSLTHAWAGDGGLIDQKEKLDARGGKQNQYANWGAITTKHEAFKSAILQSPVHVIATMRSKQEYAQTEKNGKKVIEKLGMAPIQRDGLEYEFTVVFDMAMNHEASASKDRTELFDGRFFVPTEATGKELLTWLNSGKAPIPDRLESLKKVLDPLRWPQGTVAKYCQRAYGTAKLSELNDDQFAVVLSNVKEFTFEEIDRRLGTVEVLPGRSVDEPVAPPKPGDFGAAEPREPDQEG